MLALLGAGCDTPPSTAYLRDPLLQPAPPAPVVVVAPPPVTPPPTNVFMDPLPTPPQPVRQVAPVAETAARTDTPEKTNPAAEPTKHRGRPRQGRERVYYQGSRTSKGNVTPPKKLN